MFIFIEQIFIFTNNCNDNYFWKSQQDL